MSILDSFDTSEAIIAPENIAPPISGFPETVLVTFNRKIMRALFDTHELTEIDVMHACYLVPVYRFEHEEHSFAIYQTCLGGPAAAGLLEEIIAKGAKRVLVFGSCGVLNREVVRAA